MEPEESLAPRQMDKDRLTAFCDAILAILMTLLVLELRQPESASLSAIWQLRYSYFGYTLAYFWLGLMWIGLHDQWHHIQYVSTSICFWTILMLFCASFFPYAVKFADRNFFSPVAQGFYGIIVLLVSFCNLVLPALLAKANPENPDLELHVKTQRRLFLVDIAIKTAGLVLALLVWPPAMMVSVLVAMCLIMYNRFKKGL